MKKGLFIYIVLGLFVFALSAQGMDDPRKFKDLSDQHWAAGAVYNLVKMGVVGGFPDGTFRGKQKVSRYEIAAFLSKLSDSLGASGSSKIKKDIDEMRIEIANLKAKNSSSVPVSGSVETVLRYGNLMFSDVAGHGPVSNYRVIASMMQDLGEGTSLKFNLDTMDAGYYGGDSSTFTRLIDIEGKITVDPKNIGLSEVGLSNPLAVTLSVGPGAQQHTDATGILPGEEGIVYSRPDTGVEIGTQIRDAQVSAGYFSADTATTGKINTNRLTGTVAYTFPKTIISNNLELAATGDYFIVSPLSSGAKDLRAKIDMAMPMSSNGKFSTLLGIGSSNRAGLMVGAKVDLEDAWGSGTRLSLSGSKIGSQYLSLPSQFDYAGLDAFGRPLENATVNFGGEVVQPIDKKWSLKGKGDLRLSSDFGYGKTKSKSRATAQVGLAYNIAPQTEFDAFYRLNQDPTISQTSDLTAVGMIYRF